MTAPRTLRLGTRGSALALAQSRAIAEKLGAEVVVIESDGDRSAESLSVLGGTGIFATALRQAMLNNDVDVVVHSFKDLPTTPAEGLAIAAVPPRGDARDGLCARDGLTLDTLPEGAKVGTGSPRRRAQLAARRADLQLVDIRGNVDTRLARVGSDDPDRALDAVVLAVAGLDRLGRLDAVSHYLELGWWPTAPAQGALAIETRAGETSLAAKLDHLPSRLAAEAERGVLARLEAGCSAPIAATAFLEDGMVFLTARVYAADGSSQLTASHALYAADSKDPAAELAARVATELLDAGAADLAPIGGSLR
ncbi:MAG TPA: hydroxymethylbilane synthase [Pseudolysinimonas sp.]|nr:hydroxymethylbilane synthase [Pseudolysinimonas sp.]